MSEELQRVKDALARAQQTQDPAMMIHMPVSMDQIMGVIVRQTSATNAAVLAWLEYMVQQQEQLERMDEALRCGIPTPDGSGA